MAWPTRVARNAPAIPSTVVRMNPPGLFGPGESSRAIIPATKPTMMIQRMPLISVVLPSKKADAVRSKRGQHAGPNSNPSRQFAFGRQPPVRRQVIDHLGQLLAEALEQFVARQAALRSQGIELIGAQSAA